MNNDDQSMGTNERDGARPTKYRMNDNISYERVSYNANYDGDVAERIANRVEGLKNVKDARVILDNNTVLVGVDRDKDLSDEEMDQKVTMEVQKILPNRPVTVVYNDAAYQRIVDVDNRLRNGAGYDEVRSDVNGIIRDVGQAGNDLGDAVKRPFENNK